MPFGGAESKRVHDRFAISNDPLGTFLATRCRMDFKGHVDKNRFGDALIGFCDANAIPCTDPNWLYRNLWNRYPELKEARVRKGAHRVHIIKGLVLL